MRWLALVVTLFGCNAAQRCEEDLCDSAFTLTIKPEAAGSFAPGMYTIVMTFDGQRVDEECLVGNAPSEVSRCLGQGHVTLALENFAVVAFTVKAPAAKRISVTLRAQCPTRELATRVFEPAYEQQSCGCRGASSTLAAKSGSGAFTICPDAGTD